MTTAPILAANTTNSEAHAELVELLGDSDQRLAEAIAEGQQYRPRWQRRAACRGVDTNLFYAGPGETTELARALCARCPVSAECREWALAQPDDHGVAAGMSARQRRRLRAERKRDAP